MASRVAGQSGGHHWPRPLILQRYDRGFVAQRVLAACHMRSWIVLSVVFWSGCDSSWANEWPEESADPLGKGDTIGSPGSELPDSIRWVMSSAEYRASAIQAYLGATAQVERLAAARKSSDRPWAVILDADETVLSTVEYQKSCTLSPCTKTAWLEWIHQKKAPPVPGAVGFLSRVHAVGGTIAIVTNRRERACQDTADNLNAFDIPFDEILCRPNDDRADEKAPRWAKVAEEADVLMWVGDNIKDFPGLDQSLRDKGEDAFAAFGTRFILIPNPMYGSWK